MNVANAVGFFVLGTLMHVAPELAASSQPLVASADSVRALWLELMSWVVGGIGGIYLLREGVAHVPTAVAMLVPERLLRPATARTESLPSGAQAGVSN